METTRRSSGWGCESRKRGQPCEPAGEAAGQAAGEVGQVEWGGQERVLPVREADETSSRLRPPSACGARAGSLHSNDDSLCRYIRHPHLRAVLEDEARAVTIQPPSAPMQILESDITTSVSCQLT